MKMKIMTVVGTRPEVIKLSRVISELDKYTNHILVHTNQNYDHELHGIFFESMEIRKPDYVLNVVGESPAQTVGNVIAKTDVIMAKEDPDALLLLGDTNSCLCVIAAKRRKIPIFHMEAGNRCFDERVPEEVNRRIVDHTSDINMTYTEHARRYLLAEGLRPETVIKTGSPMKEVLEYYMPKIDGSDVLDRFKLNSSGYFVVSAHREENIDNDANFRHLMETLNMIAEKYGKPVVVSTHPRTREKIESLKEYRFNELIQFLKPLSLIDYIKLQKNAFCVISDSGTITEESSILDFPAITIRQAHERPEGMDEGTLIMCGLEAARDVQSIDVVTSQHSKADRQFCLINDYNVDNVSKKVLRIIMSYTDYINRVVWNK